MDQSPERKKQVHHLIEGLLQAQLSNVDPEDFATIHNRWEFLINQKFDEVEKSIIERVVHAATETVS